MDDLVLFEKRGPLGVITLNRPGVRNAQNTGLLVALDKAFRQFADDGGLKVAVLRGAGPDFSAGHDIGSAGADYNVQFPRIATLHPGHLELPGAELRLAYEEEWYLGLCRRWRDLPKPTIAMVQGACIAGGLMLAWVCDLIVASDDAYFTDPVLRMGVPGVEYFAHPWEMSPRLAKEMLFTGKRIEAADAFRRGLINIVTSRAELEQETFALAEEIAAMPGFGLTLAKKAVNQAQDAMGMRNGVDAAFGLHQLAHSHNVEISGNPLLRHTAKTMKSAAAGRDAQNPFDKQPTSQPIRDTVSRDIERLLYEYQERLDAGDLEGMAGMFAGAEIGADEVDTVWRGKDEILALFRQIFRIYPDGSPHTLHTTLNPIIDVDEAAGTATCRSAYVVYQQVDDFPLQPIITGRYYDRFAHVDGTWRFVRRTFVAGLQGNLVAHQVLKDHPVFDATPSPKDS